MCFGPSEMFQEHSWMSIRTEHQSFQTIKPSKTQNPLVYNTCNDGIRGSDSVSGALCGRCIHSVPLRNALKTLTLA